MPATTDNGECDDASDMLLNAEPNAAPAESVVDRTFSMIQRIYSVNEIKVNSAHPKMTELEPLKCHAKHYPEIERQAPNIDLRKLTTYMVGGSRVCTDERQGVVRIFKTSDGVCLSCVRRDSPLYFFCAASAG